MRELFTKESDIQAMRQAGQLASEVLDHIAPHVQVGISTEEIDRLCHAYMRDVQKNDSSPPKLSTTRLSALPEGYLHLRQ